MKFIGLVTSFLISSYSFSMAIFKPNFSKKGMVVTTNSIASDIGAEILKKGGNAIDAACAVGFALSVVEPRAGNIGGGGFMLIHLKKQNKSIALDYRETAPKKAHKDMYLDRDGNIIDKLSLFSHLSSGVPGTVHGLISALSKYGTLPLKEVIKPAIKLAENGFIVSAYFSEDLKSKIDRFSKWEASKKIFFKKDGSVYKPGELFTQKDLAKTLKLISQKGINGFYKGKTAKLIVAEMKKGGGLITLEDLKNYKSKFREPISGTYRGHKVLSMPPPSSGGIHLIQMLNMMEAFDISSMEHNSASYIHLMTEIMKRAYADRSKHLGDSDFVNVPAKWLTSKKYAISEASKISKNKVVASKAISPGTPWRSESDQTTHYSIIDSEGNAVSNTYTLNFSYGSGITVSGAGFLLNNEMDDFSSKPGVPNAYGLIGGEKNAIAPNKRMLSSMTPTLILKDGEPIIATGSPGGSKIITTTLQVIVNMLDFKMNPLEAVSVSRFHHQWLPDYTRFEKGISIDTRNLLEKLGHNIKIQSPMGYAATVSFDPKTKLFYGASDPRHPWGKASPVNP